MTPARAKLSQEVLQTLFAENADIITIQETELLPKGPTKTLGNFRRTLSCMKTRGASSPEPARKGYAGTMFLYKKELTPTVTSQKSGAPSTMDLEGRIITLEFDKFSSHKFTHQTLAMDSKRLEERQVWDVKYAEYQLELDKEKPVLATGDYNVAHNEIDLANPAEQPPFTRIYRRGTCWIYQPLATGFTVPSAIFTAMFQNATLLVGTTQQDFKINNTGWRIDYWLLSNRVANKVTNPDMIDSGARQDHTPHCLGD